VSYLLTAEKKSRIVLINQDLILKHYKDPHYSTYLSPFSKTEVDKRDYILIQQMKSALKERKKDSTITIQEHPSIKS